MGRVIGIVLACLVVAAFITPFVRDSLAWFKIDHDYQLTQQDRDALHNWQGTPGSYMAMIRGQCQQTHPTDPRACADYYL